MRGIALVTLALAALGGHAWADDVYRWTDRSGVQHYGNAPTAGAQQTGMGYAADTFESTADGYDSDDDGDGGAGPSSGATDLQRERTGKEMRTLSQRITAIDAELAELAKVRTRFADGTAETGGLGTNAAGYLSPEEQTLIAERDRLLKDQSALESDLSKLGKPSNVAEAEVLADDAAAVATEPADPVE